MEEISKLHYKGELKGELKMEEMIKTSANFIKELDAQIDKDIMEADRLEDSIAVLEMELSMTIQKLQNINSIIECSRSIINKYYEKETVEKQATTSTYTHTTKNF